MEVRFQLFFNLVSSLLCFLRFCWSSEFLHSSHKFSNYFSEHFVRQITYLCFIRGFSCIFVVVLSSETCSSLFDICLVFIWVRQNSYFSWSCVRSSCVNCCHLVAFSGWLGLEWVQAEGDGAGGVKDKLSLQGKLLLRLNWQVGVGWSGQELWVALRQHNPQGCVDRAGVGPGQWDSQGPQNGTHQCQQTEIVSSGSCPFGRTSSVSKWISFQIV